MLCQVFHASDAEMFHSCYVCSQLTAVATHNLLRKRLLREFIHVYKTGELIKCLHFPSINGEEIAFTVTPLEGQR